MKDAEYFKQLVEIGVLPLLRGRELATLIALVAEVGVDQRWQHVSHGRLVELTGLNLRTVSFAIQGLKRRGLLFYSPGLGREKSSTFRILSHCA